MKNDEVGYEKLIVVFRRTKFSSAAVAMLGLAIGFTAKSEARLVIWITAMVLAIWMLCGGAIEERRCRRLMVMAQQTSTGSETPPESHALYDNGTIARESSGLQSASSAENHLLLRTQIQQRHARVFWGISLCGISVSIIGATLSFYLSNGVRAAVIGGFVVGGLWIAAMSLVIRRRILRAPYR